MFSVSPCPGDFNADIIDAEMGPGCIWRELFNIVWTQDQPGTAPEDIEPFAVCVGQRCGGNFTPAGIYVP